MYNMIRDRLLEGTSITRLSLGHSGFPCENELHTEHPICYLHTEHPICYLRTTSLEPMGLL